MTRLLLLAPLTLLLLACQASGTGHPVEDSAVDGSADGAAAHDGGDGDARDAVADDGGAGGRDTGAGGDSGADAGTPDGAADAGTPDGAADAGGDVACEAGPRCGEVCCDSGEACSFGVCATVSSDCAQSSDCLADEFCEFALGTTAVVPECDGDPRRDGKCLPRPSACQDGMDGSQCAAACMVAPVPAVFPTVGEAHWGEVDDVDSHVMMTPITTQLDDDNCDGRVDALDRVDILFHSFVGTDYRNNSGDAARLHAVHMVGDKLEPKWTVTEQIQDPIAGLASADLDGVPGAEVVSCLADGRTRAYTSAGQPLWFSTATGCLEPVIADLDGDGLAEVITPTAVLVGSTGVTKAPISNPTGRALVAVDADADGTLDLVGPQRIYRADGSLLVDNLIPAQFVAVAELAGGGVPEIVSVDSITHTLTVWHFDDDAPNDFTLVRSGFELLLDANGCCDISATIAGCTRGGGPPTLADFTGDGAIDVGISTGSYYRVLSGKDLVDPEVEDTAVAGWEHAIDDCSSAQAGGSAFDFDGDGASEVITMDQRRLLVLSGTDGTPRLDVCNTSGTIREYPLVVDLDADGSAEILAPSNAYSGLSCDGDIKTSGLRVFGDTDSGWPRARAIWNQHAYHQTHVQPDATVGSPEPAHYAASATNGFRSATAGFEAPDAVVELAPVCVGSYGLRARVRNVGQAPLPAGSQVEFFLGDPATGELLGSRATGWPLASSESEDLVLALDAPPAGSVYARVRTDGTGRAFQECRSDNNAAGPIEPSCP